MARQSVAGSRSEDCNFKEEAVSYLDQLYRVAFHLTKQKDDAEDLVQETYLRAVIHHEQFNSGTNLKAWLSKILYNLFVNRYRRDKRSVSLNQPASETQGSWLDSLESNDSGPEAEILRTELRDKLKDALEGLSEEFATPVVLVDMGELSYAEVAEILGCPIGTVRSRLFRARSALANKLRKYVQQEK